LPAPVPSGILCRAAEQRSEVKHRNMTSTTHIQIQVNGAPRALSERTSVLALLEQLGFRPEIVAVELNERLLPREQRASTFVKSGDRVEVVTLVGGG
jgi:sulfur carrier protein